MKKNIPSEKSKTGKKKIIIIAGLTVAAILIIFFVLKLLVKTENISDSNQVENKMQKENAFPFKKQGELSFLSKENKVISTIEIEIAETEETRAQGLMYRTKLEQKQGMLFIFMFEEMQSFWMKNTFLPLDILFVNAKKEIIKIHSNTTPFQENPGYESGKPAMYVVEVNGGYCDKQKIKEGDKLIFSRF